MRVQLLQPRAPFVICFTGFGSMRPFGLALQTADRSQSSGRMSDDNGARTSSSSGRPKKVVTINIE